MKLGIGKRIRAWRKERGLSQNLAARGAGISQAEWHKLESDRFTRIGLRTALHVVSYMGGEIALADLCGPGRLPTPAPGPLPKPHRRSHVGAA
jgi:transcriptional regulator with XRE-family HTH domain